MDINKYRKSHYELRLELKPQRNDDSGETFRGEKKVPTLSYTKTIDGIIEQGINNVKNIPINTVQGSEEVLLRLYEPLLVTHFFGVSGKNNITYRRNETYASGNVLRGYLTIEHAEVFCQEVETRMKEYVNIVARNKQVFKKYQIPEFTKQEAKEIAREAIETSFWKARTSYVNVIKSRNGYK